MIGLIKAVRGFDEHYEVPLGHMPPNVSILKLHRRSRAVIPIKASRWSITFP
jgi:hypothetical protein